jgi:polyribonucleotide nucleotidyltransferase
VASATLGSRGEGGGERGRGGDRLRREGEDRPERGGDEGPAPEFAPAFLTRDDD